MSEETQDLVKLNVGGVYFESSKETLTKVPDSMLGRMFGRCDIMLQADAEGSIFIDRHGDHFGLILDYLRDGDAFEARRTIRALPEEEQEAMLQELDYFGLETAVLTVPWFEGAAFSRFPNLNTPWPWTVCAAVQVGRRVCVFSGGKIGRGRLLAFGSTVLFNLDTMSFVRGPAMLSRRFEFAAVALDAHRVLVVGGNTPPTPGLKTSEILDLNTLRFRPGPTLQSKRSRCAVVALDARRILVVGGDGVAGASSDVLNLGTLAYTPGPTMRSARSWCVAVRLDAHRCLVVGGTDTQENVLSSTEVLDIASMTFTAGPELGTARSACSAAPLDSRHVLVVGGRDAKNVLESTEVSLFLTKCVC